MNDYQDAIQNMIEQEKAEKRRGLRDRFAMAALTGWLATFPDDYHADDVNCEPVASLAYEMADAMLKAREA